jgi:hypothetical protein
MEQGFFYICYPLTLAFIQLKTFLSISLENLENHFHSANQINTLERSIEARREE